MQYKREYLFTIIRLTTAFLIGYFLSQADLYYIEALTYDARVRVSPTPKASEDIEIVSVDRTTLETLKRNPDASDFRLVLENIIQSKPKAIVIFQRISDLEGPYEDIWGISQLAFENRNIWVAHPNSVLPTEFDKIQLPPPFEDIPVLPGPVAVDMRSFAADNVSRRAIIGLEDKSYIHLHLAELLNSKSSVSEYRGVWDFKGSSQIYTHYREPGSYATLSFLSVMDHKFELNRYKDKVVLIGRASETQVDEYVQTPFSRDVLAMSKLEVHAHVLDTLISDNAIIRSSDWLNTLITCLISVFIGFVVFWVQPIQGVIALVLTFFCYSFLSYTLFAVFGYWVTMAHPLIALFLSYYLFIPYRLIKENRKSWEYQQKNRLLIQVEELKNNFMSMMSHDLKTPLARIQGMTEVALQNPDNLDENQKRAIKMIRQSSEELTLFIGSILDLSRVESKELKLHLTSKDPNALLEEIVKKLLDHAKEKEIEIITEFEPLFSIKMDVDLMRQVFTNLIENAIKYSPNGSKVLVSTEEDGDNVLIQIADQGRGISKKELGKIFMKFYRSEDAKKSPIKGSGLGLYLARYFVELHKGKISAESVPGQGSTFSVELPMNI